MKKILLKIFLKYGLPFLAGVLIELYIKHIQKKGEKDEKAEGDDLFDNVKAKKDELTEKLKKSWESASKEGTQELKGAMTRLKKTAVDFLANVTGKSPQAVEEGISEAFGNFEKDFLDKFGKKEDGKKEDGKKEEPKKEEAKDEKAA